MDRRLYIEKMEYYYSNKRNNKILVMFPFKSTFILSWEPPDNHSLESWEFRELGISEDKYKNRTPKHKELIPPWIA